MQEYIHLHNHTDYSLLDAIATPKTLIEAALADGQKALAITDHGVMFGCRDFYKVAKDKGIKPILGMEAYVASGSRLEKIAGKSKDSRHRNYYHLLLLAKDMAGYKNLMKLTTLAHKEGYYYKPRIDRELLEKYHEGLVAASACIVGVVNAHLVAGNFDEAYEAAKYYKDLFGEDFYLELQKHNLPEDDLIMEHVPKMATELDIKLLATNDIHYIKKEHAVAHNVMLYIRDVTAATSGTFDIYKLRYGTPEMYFKTQEQMNELFKDLPQALDSSIEIADKCNLEFVQKLYMPDFPIPKESESKTLEDYLVEITNKGIKEKFPQITDEISQRLEYELNVIKSMGFAGYFLIVWDFVKAAKELGVRVGPGRGSAAGSLVAYALGITNINPLPYDLLFERFLNPDRVSMPDIDIDFSDDKREKVIEYVKQKYGEESVAFIITFGKLTARAAVTDVGRVIGVPLSTCKDITSKIPVVRGKVTPIERALDMHELKWLKKTEDPKIKELIDFTLVIEDRIRNASTHAAGVVIAPGEITDYVPLYYPSKSKNQNGEAATQYSMNELEEAGLLKMDFLGLRTLSILDNTLDMIERNHSIKIEIDEIDFDDSQTYDLLSSGNTLAVFQFESPGMQDYLRKLKPRNLEELTAMNALYRPGPMENIPEFIDRKLGKKPIEYLHPIMIKSLEKTYGVIVYQEQVIQLVRDIADFTLGQADLLRRAMGKKKKSEMDKQKPKFIEGAARHGIEEKLADEIFDLIYKFADYGFNKSHSLAYSYLAFQTAWLKTHYPAEFLAANMTAELNFPDKIVPLIDEAKTFGIKVVPPDVNYSMASFNAINNTIFFGMAGIKNVGIPAVESIVKAREEKPFTSFFDFASRVDIRLVNKRSLEALVCAGAFSSLTNVHRAALFQSIESALDFAKAFQGNTMSNVENLFGGAAAVALVEPAIQDVPEWTDKERLEKEKEALNFYISGHPLNRYAPYVSSFSTISLGNTESNLIGHEVRVCGMITEIRNRLDKNNKPISFVKLEDFTGKAECIFWSDSYLKYQQYIREDSVVMCIGRSDLDNDTIKIVVDEVIPMDAAIKRFAKGYKVWLDLEKVSPEIIKTINEHFCTDKKAKTRIFFNISDKTRDYYSTYLASDLHIPLNDETTTKLVELAGQNNVGFLIQ